MNTGLGLSLIKKLLLNLIEFYQKRISPIKGRTCRFYPSCSEYTRQAVLKYGPLKGSYMGIKRVLKCHPFHPGGYDPVP